jgi:hypothetical protein
VVYAGGGIGLAGGGIAGGADAASRGLLSASVALVALLVAADGCTGCAPIVDCMQGVRV